MLYYVLKVYRQTKICSFALSNTFLPLGLIPRLRDSFKIPKSYVLSYTGSSLLNLASYSHVMPTSEHPDKRLQHWNAEIIFISIQLKIFKETQKIDNSNTYCMLLLHIFKNARRTDIVRFIEVFLVSFYIRNYY